MRRNFILLLSLVALAVACQKDDITTITDTTSGATNGNSSDTTGSVTTDFDRTVAIVFSNSGAATVSGMGGEVSAIIDGNDVTIYNTGEEKVLYNLSGSTDNGFLKIYSGRKQGIGLNGVNIKNTRGAAINVQGLVETPAKGKRVDVFLNGSSTLADGSTYSLTPSTEDEKAAFFSEGQIVFSGNGALTVTATGKAGITSDDWVQFTDDITLNVSSSAGHGVRGKDYILVSGGTIDISVSANGKKGFSSDSLVRFDGGETTIRLTGNTVVDRAYAQLRSEHDKLVELIKMANAREFGARSERVLPHQLSLFNDMVPVAGAETAITAWAPRVSSSTATSRFPAALSPSQPPSTKASRPKGR